MSGPIRGVGSPERKRPAGNGALSKSQRIGNVDKRISNTAPRSTQWKRTWAREII